MCYRFFCKENDEEDLARVIKKVMDLPEKKRREIGRRAREVVVERFDKDKQGKEVCGVSEKAG